MKRTARTPVTHHVSVDDAVATLSREDMVALTDMFCRWALTEGDMSPENRTRLMQMSADYEQIAAFVGPGWQPRDDGCSDAMSFVADLERAAQ